MPDRLQRYIASGLAAAWTVWLLDSFLPAGSVWPFPLGTILALAATVLVWLARSVPRLDARAWAAIRVPVGYGLATAACGLLLADETRGLDSDAAGLAASTGVAFILLLILWQILRAQDVPPGSRQSVVTLGLAALGFHVRERALVFLALAFLLVFGGHYYYSLELDLLAKSGVLVACSRGRSAAHRSATIRDRRASLDHGVGRLNQGR